MLPEEPDSLWHESLTDAWAGDNMHAACTTLTQLLRQVVDPRYALMDLIHLGKEPPGLGGWLDAAFYTLKELQTETVFRICEQSADRRLRYRQQASRAANRACHHDSPKNLDLTQIETHERTPCYGLALEIA